jgi:hypothetical protein
MVYCGRLNPGPFELAGVRVLYGWVHLRGFEAVTTLRSIAVSPELCVAEAEFDLAAVKNC